MLADAVKVLPPELVHPDQEEPANPSRRHLGVSVSCRNFSEPSEPPQPSTTSACPSHDTAWAPSDIGVAADGSSATAAAPPGCRQRAYAPPPTKGCPRCRERRSYCRPPRSRRHWCPSTCTRRLDCQPHVGGWRAGVELEVRPALGRGRGFRDWSGRSGSGLGGTECRTHSPGRSVWRRSQST